MSLFLIDGVYYDNVRRIIEKNCECAGVFSEPTMQLKRTGIIIGGYFILTNSCNLNCVYCFAKRYRKQDRLVLDEAKPLVLEIIKNSVLCRILGMPGFVPYFKFSGGGEPTLNFDTMCQITDFAKSLLSINDLAAEFHLATNGQWNDPRINEWISNNITNLLFSVDGIEAINNTHRPRIDGKNGYGNVVTNLQRLDNSDINITFRMTVSNFSLPYLAESVSVFGDLGVKNIQIEPLMPFEVKKDLCEPDPVEFAKQYSAVKYQHLDMNIFSSFDVFDQTDNSPCGHQAGNIVSLFPGGIISSCPEHALQDDEDYFRGIIRDGKLSVTKQRDINFQYRFERCEDCIVSFKCDLCKSKIGLFTEKCYDTKYLCVIYREIFKESLHHFIGEKSIDRYCSFAYDINKSRYLFTSKGDE